MAQASPSSECHGTPPATLLSHLQGLVQPALGLPPAYLHPFAPLSGPAWPDHSASLRKGKGRETSQYDGSLQTQLEIVRHMRQSVEQAKAVLSKRSGEGDWAKLSRALKEISSHQSVLLPLSSTLEPSLLRANGVDPPLIPSLRISLSPVQLLPSLAQAHDIQTYHEDSQFGLLKATVTLAGNCFVIDIDLETDAAAEDEEGTGTVPPTPSQGVTAAPQPAAGPPTAIGTVRLSKIAVSYVTPEGGMEASGRIAGVFKAAINEYLALWNAPAEGLMEEKGRAGQLEVNIRRVDGLLGEMKALDGSVPIQGKDPERLSGFADLETVSKRVKGFIHRATGPIYPSAQSSIHPSFHLFPPDKAKLGTPANPIFRIRPSRPGEAVPCPFPRALQGGSDVTMNNESGELSGSASSWILEIPSSAHSSAGLAVRRNWLGADEGIVSPWDGAVKIENLLYKPSEGSRPSSQPISPFPYQARFMSKSKAMDDHPALEQHWFLPIPGPDGYILGRLGLPGADEDLDRLLVALRRQILLNALFSSVFTSTAMSTSTTGDSKAPDEDDELDDLFSPPTAIPIDVTLTQTGLFMTSPLPGCNDAGATLQLEITVDIDNGGAHLRAKSDVSAKRADVATLQGVVDEAIQDGLPHDLCEVFSIVDNALRGRVTST